MLETAAALVLNVSISSREYESYTFATAELIKLWIFALPAT